MLIEVFKAADASVDHTSPTFDVSGSNVVGCQLVQAGGSSIVGTLAINGSLDVPPYGASPGTGWQPTNWFPLSQNGNWSQNVMTPGTYSLGGSLGYVKWLQLVWTFTSGSGGTVSASLFAQDDAALSG